MAESSGLKQFMREEVREHNSKTSNWLIIHDHVYDVTKFLYEHPGGEDLLLQNGGHDATASFEDAGHSSDAVEMMQKFCIGQIVESQRKPKPSAEEKSSKKGECLIQ